MAKAIASASEFLAAVAAKSHQFEVAGVTIELRSLEWAEAEELLSKYGDKPAQMAFQAAVKGIKSPPLDEVALAQFHRAQPGAIQAISGEVMRLSGMVAEAGGGPLDGTGSSVSP